jgi:hypothetical protein
MILREPRGGKNGNTTVSETDVLGRGQCAGIGLSPSQNGVNGLTGRDAKREIVANLVATSESVGPKW